MHFQFILEEKYEQKTILRRCNISVIDTTSIRLFQTYTAGSRKKTAQFFICHASFSFGKFKRYNYRLTNQFFKIKF